MGYDQFGMYGVNPHYTLAETPYARMTGLFTPINKQQIPNAASYLQPMFVNMNAYTGNKGIPSYPSFIGGMAMQNPDIPIIRPDQINAWQQQYQNYPPHQQYPPQQYQQYPPQQYQQYPPQQCQQYPPQQYQQYPPQQYQQYPPQQYSRQPNQIIFNYNPRVIGQPATIQQQPNFFTSFIERCQEIFSDI